MRVLICDDQAIIRNGLVRLLKLEPDMDVVGCAADGVDALALAAQHAPDLVLMDLKMPRMNGVEATRRLHASSPQTRVLILTTYDDDAWVMDAIRAGAVGYILKDAPVEDLLAALRGTMAGKAYLDPAVAGKLIERLGPARTPPASAITAKLTERELSVLRLIAHGLNNAAIAERLHLSEGTVRNNVSAILQKLEMPDRIQAALLAIQHGIHE